MSFTLHPQLAADSAHIGDRNGCRLLLMNNAAFPWLILVPIQESARELFDLSDSVYQTVCNEVRTIAERFSQITGADKMNIAALGNMVPQLHIHIIARFKGDNAWPSPVWSATAASQKYTSQELAELLKKLRHHLEL